MLIVVLIYCFINYSFVLIGHLPASMLLMFAVLSCLPYIVIVFRVLLWVHIVFTCAYILWDTRSPSPQ